MDNGELKSISVQFKSQKAKYSDKMLNGLIEPEALRG